MNRDPGNPKSIERLTAIDRHRRLFEFPGSFPKGSIGPAPYTIYTDEAGVATGYRIDQGTRALTVTPGFGYIPSIHPDSPPDLWLTLENEGNVHWVILMRGGELFTPDGYELDDGETELMELDIDQILATG